MPAPSGRRGVRAGARPAVRPAAAAAAAVAAASGPALGVTATGSATMPASASADGAGRDAGATLPGALQAAAALVRDERLDEAEAALAAILARWPQEPNALHFQGLLRHAQDRPDDAVALIRRALAQAPDNAGAWSNLGNVLLAAGRTDEALAAYERGVAVARPGQPGRAEAHNNLGSLYRRLHRSADAEAACRRAIDERPDFGDAWYNLSQALLAQGRVHEGLLANGRAIALWPRHLQARDQVIRALLLLGEREQAAVLYRQWLAEEPDNPVVRHQLAACLAGGAPGGGRPAGGAIGAAAADDAGREGGRGRAGGIAGRPAGDRERDDDDDGGSAIDVPDRASDAYVRTVFDAFAASFDAKLERLHYRAPALVAQALADAVGGAPAAALDIVDAGCGTGLCGLPLRPWARRLAGCDLSVGMLRRAHARRRSDGGPLYDVLHQAELVHYLSTQPATFDAVVSADTLCYFGPLDEALAAARRALRPGGRLVFTVEALPPSPADAGHAAPDHALLSHGRYAHARPYLRRAVAGSGLALCSVDAVTLRQEAGQDVDGWLVVAQAAAA